MKFKSKQEFLWIFVVSTLILAFGSLPTWAGYWAETQDLRFRGIYFNTQDYSAHIAMMEAGMHGNWTYQFRFTTEPFTPSYMRIFYIVLGNLGNIFNIQNEQTYHLARWLLGFVALFALYRLTQQIFPNLTGARTAFVLAALGSGLGWLQLIFNWVPSQVTPIDFWLIDSYVFFSLSIFPHFAFVIAATCITLDLWLDFLITAKPANIFWIAFLAVLVQFANPIAFATVNIGLLGAATFSWWKKSRIQMVDVIALGYIAIAQVPLFIYNVAILQSDLFWMQYTTQHQTLSPSPIYYFWGFGPFWLPAILGTIYGLRNKSTYSGASIFWILTAFLLAYSPLYTQRRFTQNITIPLAILAIDGLIGLYKTKLSQKLIFKQRQKSFIILFVFMTSFSSIQLSLGRTLYTQTYPSDLYYPALLDRAVNWLRENAQYNDFVLASEKTSQVLAQKAGTRAYLGHEMETLNYEAKLILVNEYFNGKRNIATAPIKWVVYGPYEYAINPAFEPVGLELVYEEQDLKIYKVK